MYKTTEKLVKLSAYALVAFNTALFFHYLASALKLDSLKFLIYGGLIVFSILIFVFEDLFKEYLELNSSIGAIFAVISIGFFGGGCFRAITLNEKIEAILLGAIPSILALILFVFYVKILILNFKGES